MGEGGRGGTVIILRYSEHHIASNAENAKRFASGHYLLIDGKARGLGMESTYLRYDICIMSSHIQHQT